MGAKNTLNDERNPRPFSGRNKNQRHDQGDSLFEALGRKPEKPKTTTDLNPTKLSKGKGSLKKP
jgi:hypothetical protein